MVSKPSVSVIIPAFNAAALIGETLVSILAQGYEPLEIIVVDDGSTDDTAPVVRGFGPAVRYYYRENSGSCAVPRNDGMELSSGDLLCFMDADDIMAPHRIARQVNFMERFPRVGLVFGDYRNFNENGPAPESHFQTCPGLRSRLTGLSELVLENACPLLASENFGIAGSFMMRRWLLEYETGFEPTLRACEDFHFYYRLARHAPAGVRREVGMMRRIHGNNMSGNPVRMLTEGIRSRTMLRDTEDDPRSRALLDLYIAGCHRSLARVHADNGRYWQALNQDRLALSRQVSLSAVAAACKNVARTALTAAGLRANRQPP